MLYFFNASVMFLTLDTVEGMKQIFTITIKYQFLRSVIQISSTFNCK
jgi:hypothetical protein